LIVSCARCATQFQLEEARVPESGIRVRCSVCKHAFFVEHPDGLGESPADPITRAVEDVLRREAGGAPEATRDLEAMDAAPRASAGARGADEGEPWEFNDGGRFSEAARRDAGDRFEASFEVARSAVDELLGAPGAAAAEPAPARWPVSLDPAPEPEPLRESEPEPEPEPARSDEVPLAGDPWEDPVWTRDERGSDDPDLGPEIAAAASDDELELDDGEGLEIEADDEFESGEDLDELELDAPAAAEAPDAADPGAWELDGAGDPGRPLEATGALGSALAEPTAETPLGPAPLLEPASARARAAWLGRAGEALGAALVALLAAVAFWASAAPRTRTPVPAHSQELAGLEAAGVAGRWVEHATLGSLYVVSGELHNPGPEPRAPAALLVVRLLDAEGVALGAQVASLAPPLGSAWLREAEPGDLRAARAAGARELARTPLAAGARVAFEGVVEGVPEAARRFDLAAVPLAAIDPEP
jgi:predicted Zn finger-like uncharacterized protein